MHVAVTGGTGFVGRPLIAQLLARGHTVTAVLRPGTSPPAIAGNGGAAPDWLEGDVHALPPELLRRLASADVVAHLAWPGLPNYQALFHLDETLPREMAFLRALVEAGAARLLVTGTCFEYGLQDGELRETAPTCPVTAYGMAKDGLHRYLNALRRHVPFLLQWARLFYLHGPGQNPKSLLSQLDAAIDRGDTHFPMSAGEQLRDYLSVEDAARRLLRLLETPTLTGAVNVASGRPLSIRRLVEKHMETRGVSLRLDLGHYPYPSYEPLAFWAGVTKYEEAIGDTVMDPSVPGS